MDLISSFEQELYCQGLSESTVDGHIEAVHRITGEIGQFKPTIAQAKKYISQLFQSDYSYHHKTNSAVSLEYWMKHIGREIEFGRPKKPTKLVKDTLNESEITRLIDGTKNIREKAMVSTLAYSGVRPKEFCNLRVRNIDFGNNEIMVELGKEKKDGIVHVCSELINTIMDYLQEYERDENDYLFTTLRHDNQYHRRDIYKVTKVVADRTSIDRDRVYPYIFRHSLATNMIKRGAPILEVKEQMRHENLETTMRYIHSMGGWSQTEKKTMPQYS